MMSFSHYTIGGLVPASMIAIFGHFLYQRRDEIVRYGWLAPAVFVCMNGIGTLFCSEGFETILSSTGTPSPVSSGRAALSRFA